MSEQSKVDSTTPPLVPPELAGKSLTSIPALPGSATEADAKQPLVRDDDERTAEPGPALAFASDEHMYIRDYIALADQKAGSLFAILAAMLAYLQVQNAPQAWLVRPTAWSVFEALAFVAVAGLLIGAVLALLVVAPRLRGSNQGLVFWEAVARFPSGEDYAEQVINSDARRLLRAKLEHCHALAGVCSRKYRTLTYALWFGGVGLAASLLYLTFAPGIK